MGSLEAAGARLKQLRLRAGLTQQQLAQKAGVSYFTISKIEQGKTKLPSASVLYKLAATIGFDIDELLGKTAKKTTKPTIKFFYSDIGGVLVHTESALFHHLTVDINRRPDAVKAFYYTYVPIACLGKLTLEDLQLLMLLKLHIRYKSTRKNHFFKHWVDYMKPIPEGQMFVSQISTKVPTGLLTDTIDGFVERMQKDNLLPDLKFRAIIKSSDVGVVKPDPKIYEIATKKAGVKPSEILFIDDKKINVKGARDYGWQAEWFNELRPKASVARIRRKYF